MDHNEIGLKDVYWIYKVVQIWPGLICINLHTNQSWSYLNHLVCGSGQGPVMESCEHDNDPSGSIKGGKFFGCLNIY
jgi:hypothetical protein